MTSSAAGFGCATQNVDNQLHGSELYQLLNTPPKSDLLFSKKVQRQFFEDAVDFFQRAADLALQQPIECAKFDSKEYRERVLPLFQQCRREHPDWVVTEKARDFAENLIKECRGILGASIPPHYLNNSDRFYCSQIKHHLEGATSDRSLLWKLSKNIASKAFKLNEAGLDAFDEDTFNLTLHLLLPRLKNCHQALQYTFLQFLVKNICARAFERKNVDHRAAGELVKEVLKALWNHAETTKAHRLMMTNVDWNDSDLIPVDAADALCLLSDVFLCNEGRYSADAEVVNDLPEDVEDSDLLYMSVSSLNRFEGGEVVVAIDDPVGYFQGMEEAVTFYAVVLSEDIFESRPGYWCAIVQDLGELDFETSIFCPPEKLGSTDKVIEASLLQSIRSRFASEDEVSSQTSEGDVSDSDIDETSVDSGSSDEDSDGSLGYDSEPPDGARSDHSEIF